VKRLPEEWGRLGRSCFRSSEEGFSEAVASAVTGGVLGKAGEELVRKGGGVIDALLGSRRDEE
jgi:hypothetical protein